MDHPPCGEVGEGGFSKHRDDRVAHFLPDEAERALEAHRAGLRMAPGRATDRGELPLEEPDDPLECDLHRSLLSL